MNEFDRLLDETFPAAPVSDALRSRVANLPRPRPERKPALRNLWLASAGMAGLALSVALLMPRNASAQALIAKASQGFVGHTRTFTIDAKGKRRFESEAWYAPGKTRQENAEAQGRTIMIANAERGFTLYVNPQTGISDLVERSFSGQQLSFPSTLDPQTLAEILRGRGNLPVPALTDAVLDGQKVKKADLMRNGEGSVLYGAPDTLRLIAYEAVWTPPHRGRIHELTYLEPGNPPPERFDPVIEIEGRPIDLLKDRERVRKRLAKPLAEYPVPGGKIEVRGVTMNRNHDLFVLYTALNAGYGNDYLPSAITDDAGGVYVRGIGFRPYGLAREGRWPGYTFDGKPLEGAWYARLGSGTPTKVTINFRRQSEPGWPNAFRHVQPVKPLAVDVPDFMPFMSMGLGSLSRLEEGRTFAFTEYYDRTKKWADMERLARRSIALVDPRLEAVGVRGNELMHYLLAKALTMQGKKAEARREIAEARSRADSMSGSALQRMLKELEAQLGRRQ
jgi:hypothetical protein